MIGAKRADPPGGIYSGGQTYVIFGKSSFISSLELSYLGKGDGFIINGVN
ncbi:MAG: hypothetical protein MRQ05_04785 [Candidatus Midichloria mitochondrii]|nr:hypothetical protein [Candidatus Midichloria mitochondrii]MDJ1256998.1 hypothetical protein [Candidatus Midichloria mitochondrii]MDJ1288754.1 hypothetical protein [Candidatus Midichloria mitochondrii]MDJ1299342.1 hypothetical protein [Candidatus Midichloria mitochondrii]MDJ1313414.1 hypothetical protein [Candidatus Midichloria mitochondrii]